MQKGAKTKNKKFFFPKIYFLENSQSGSGLGQRDGDRDRSECTGDHERDPKGPLEQASADSAHGDDCRSSNILGQVGRNFAFSIYDR